ncbi:YfcC family protein [Pontixanthobacter gangjinensis]|uniref:Putative basic amino acid antiporter YfcC n=1 Tax=Christiangramia aestuarii TaxID=1028746 RepID=A0A7M3SWK7_9FLAO|nr:TIGR00366 family protein [Christiangramia aestuarii]MUP40988.1 putative basic amino acid antiporter YfcC [Christiangramia aestuarii]
MSKTRKFPDTIAIILGISLVFIILTWIIPAGEFEREIVDGTEMIVAGSYEKLEANPQGIGAFLSAPIKGFISAAFVIGFVFLVGGAFSLINATGAINAGLFNVIKFAERNPQYKHWIVPILTVLFSLAGATFGMSEEILVFVLITIPLANALGYDAIIGAGIPVIGTGVGFAGAITNPFTIGIAQGIAQVPLFGGMEYRLVVWVVLTLIAAIALYRYSRKIEKDPKNSLLAGMDIKMDESLKMTDFPELNNRRKIILYGLLFTLGLLIYGVNTYGWYINEIAALFIGLSIFAAVVYRISVSRAIEAFVDGAKDMMKAALIIGLAKGLLIIAEDGLIIDTMLHSVASIAVDTPKYLSAGLMFLFQCSLNFFIPSGSGQAALTMPIMAPLSDVLGIGRQIAVLAFQMGDGLTNIIVPTSGVTMGVLSIAKIPYNTWLKWAFPIVLILILVSMLLLLPPLYLFEW